MGIGPTEWIIILLVFGLASLLMIVPYWKIFAKAGYSGALALLLLVPFVNIGMLFFLAFSKWPIELELESYKEKS